MARIGLTLLNELKKRRIVMNIKLTVIDSKIKKLEEQIKAADEAELRANDNRLRIEIGMETL